VRADRLVAILLMLQRRERVTAAEVATELEVSERTARRDLDALGVAGVPVYSVQGRNGGWRLAGGGRTDLSGLTAGEARALFLVAGTGQEATPAVRAALRKLLRALPEPLRDHAEAAGRSTIVDRQHWDRNAGAGRWSEHERPAPPLLDTVQGAVIDGVQLEIEYVDRRGNLTERRIDPLGLASKAGQWYLVAATDHGQRTFRVDRLRGVVPTGEHVERPADFDLHAAWQAITGEVDRLRTPIRAEVRVDGDAVWRLRWTVGDRLQIGPPGQDGRVEGEVRGVSVAALAGELAAFGPAVEVTGPDDLRRALAQLGAVLLARYGDAP
jgi:predicted DNA-binding transcriptional regulator YafY